MMLGIQKSVSMKNNLLTKYIKVKDLTLRNETQNLISVMQKRLPCSNVLFTLTNKKSSSTS